MKILITGSKGQLGQSIKRIAEQYLFEFIYTDVEELDITNREELDIFFKKNKIDTLINCAAYTQVDKAQEEREEAFLINADAVGNLARMSKKYDFHLIQISTDYVFNGKNYRALTEDYKAKPINIYGKSKLAGEEAVIKHASHGSIIRTSWLYSEYGANFLKTILRISQEHAEIKVVYDQIGTPTYAGDLAKMLLDNIFHFVLKDEIEIYHYSNEGVCSWYDFACEILEYTQQETKVIPIETKDYRTPAARPYFSLLSKEKIKTNFEIEIPYWKDSVKHCIRRYYHQQES